MRRRTGRGASGVSVGDGIRRDAERIARVAPAATSALTCAASSFTCAVEAEGAPLERVAARKTAKISAVAGSASSAIVLLAPFEPPGHRRLRAAAVRRSLAEAITTMACH